MKKHLWMKAALAAASGCGDEKKDAAPAAGAQQGQLM